MGKYILVRVAALPSVAVVVMTDLGALVGQPQAAAGDLVGFEDLIPMKGEPDRPR